MNKRLLAAVLAAAFAAEAQASLTTVEPDDFTDGQDISSLTPGVVLQLESGNPVYAYDEGDPDYASTGTKVFGYEAGFGVEPYWDDLNVFRATFSGLVNFVSIDVVNNDEAGTGDSAYMEVFGIGGLLATIYSDPIGFPDFQALVYQGGAADISYIRLSSSDGGDYNLDRLQFGIPETPTLALLGVGMLGLFARRPRALGRRRVP